MADHDGSPTADDARRRRLLEASVSVFARYGFRKTSMEEVARAADVSRQALYLHFATKEELFRAAVRHLLETSLSGATTRLADGSLPIGDRLVFALDAWMGRFVGAMGGGAVDLVEASNALLGPVVAEHEERFVDAVVKSLRASGLAAAYKPAGLTARQLADTLYATARGLKHGSSTRASFVEGLALAVRALCLPLIENR